MADDVFVLIVDGQPARGAGTVNSRVETMRLMADYKNAGEGDDA